MKLQTIKIDTITSCNKFFSTKTLHPSVCLIPLSDARCKDLLQLDFYSIWLKEKSCHFNFGRKEYDFSNGTVSFQCPNQPINMNMWDAYRGETGHLLCFHPNLFHRTPFEKQFSDYTFFYYRQNEALHVSAKEKTVIHECLDSIAEELQWGLDEYSLALITGKIEMLLNHCARFYHRQFTTRHEMNKEMLKKADQLLANYFLTGQAQLQGLPNAEYFSRMLGLSPAYFDDLLKYEIGQTTENFVQLKRIGIACELLRRTSKSTTLIAKELGFPSGQFFCRLFCKLTGSTPNKYRTLN